MILSLRTRINLQELEDIIANDDTGFAREDVLSTHICDFLYVVWFGPDCERRTISYVVG